MTRLQHRSRAPRQDHGLCADSGRGSYVGAFGALFIALPPSALLIMQLQATFGLTVMAMLVVNDLHRRRAEPAHDNWRLTAAAIGRRP